MFIVGGKIEMAGQRPLRFIDSGEEGVAIQHGVYPGHIDAIGYRHGFSVDLSAADDEAFLAIRISGFF